MPQTFDFDQPINHGPTAPAAKSPKPLVSASASHAPSVRTLPTHGGGGFRGRGGRTGETQRGGEKKVLFDRANDQDNV